MVSHVPEAHFDPYQPARVYYADATPTPATEYQQLNKTINRTRTLSTSHTHVGRHNTRSSPPMIRRRYSQDESTAAPRKFLVNVEQTLKALLESEDTDGNMQITIEDMGPKVMQLGTANSNGFNRFDIRGTYMLSNLLQELTLAKDYGRSYILLDERRLNENPVNRLSRLIRGTFWDGLTRRIDASMLEIICADPKNRSGDSRPRIYVPPSEKAIYDYYCAASAAKPHLNLLVEYLPEYITEEWVRDVNTKPGLLALAMEEHVNQEGKTELRGVPFVVPGGRFNELYGWDSYFESLGLIVDGRIDLARGMVENFIFEIKHYGKILNANRSYYLMRSQPPFLTDMTIQIYEKIKHEEGALDFLRRGIEAAIKEYFTVWICEPRLDPITGLSRFRPGGLGIPPETEASHFTHILQPFADKHGMTFSEFQHAYNYQQVHEPELDAYFLHDRAVRESGHDTSYRLEKRCADLATVDLNSLLYKYETDISRCIRERFNDRFVCAGVTHNSASWDRRAKQRKSLMDKYLWNAKEGMYFDYDTRLRVQSDYESATSFWALWAGVASPKQAGILVEMTLPKLEAIGGLLAGTERSRGKISLKRPNRQWDYPYGWAPHQILAWKGLERYGYEEEAKRLVYRWMYTMTKSFVDYNGVVVEKYDVTSGHDPHRVDAEYGNQGGDIKGVAREGFGWVNASFSIGMSYCDVHMRRALGTITPPDIFFRGGILFDGDAATLHPLNMDRLTKDMGDTQIADLPVVQVVHSETI